MIKKYKELFLYGIIGASCASLDFAVYSSLLNIFNGEYLLMCNTIGVLCGIVASFILNRQFNFKVKDKTRQRFASFLTVGLIGLAISSALIYLLVTTLGYNEQIAKLMTIVVVSLVQFVLNKKITFNRRLSFSRD